MFQQIILPSVVLFTVVALFFSTPIGLIIKHFMDEEEKKHIQEVWHGDVEAYERYACGEGS